MSWAAAPISMPNKMMPMMSMPEMYRTAGPVPITPRRSVDQLVPIDRHPIARAGHGLLRWMGLGIGQRRAVGGLFGQVVPVPVLARLETLHEAVAGGPVVPRGVLGRG